MKHSSCTDCGDDIETCDDYMECLLCDNLTHATCCHQTPNNCVSIKLIAATPNFFYVCNNCVNFVSNETKRNLFRKHIGAALQSNSNENQSSHRKSANNKHENPATNTLDWNQPSSTSLTEIISTTNADTRTLDLETVMNSILLEQKRISNIVENIMPNGSSPSAATSMSRQLHTKSGTSSTTSTSSSESFETAITFQPSGTTTYNHCTELKQIESMPAVGYTTLSDYNIVTIAEDHDSYCDLTKLSDAPQYTGMLQIIGVRTNDPAVFTRQLLLRNRWLQLKYIHVNRIYKTEFSYSKSYNYIITVDAAAHQACLECGTINITSRCSIYNYSVPSSCARCHQHDHEIETCQNHVMCKLCAENHHHSVCTVKPGDYKCVNCLKANSEGNAFPVNHKATYRGCPSRCQHLESDA